MKCCKIPFKAILVGLTRLVGLAYVVIAGFAIPESLKLLEESYKKEGKTLYVPLLVCEPKEIEVEGAGTVAFNSTETYEIGQCHNVEYLIQVVMLSLAFGMAAMVVFFVFDLLATKKIGPYRKSTVLGMGLFLIFILVQSTICTLALARECLYWLRYFNRIYQDAGFDDAYDIDTIKTYGNSTLLFATSGVASLAGLLLLFEAVAKACCCKGGDDDDDSLVHGVPKSSLTTTTRTSPSKRGSSLTAGKDLDLQENTESSTLDGDRLPTVDLAPLASSPRLDDSGNPNPDMPSWLTGG